MPIETEPSKYDDLVVPVLLALNPVRVYESIILSGTAGLACPQALCLGRPHVERSLGGLPFDCAAY